MRRKERSKERIFAEYIGTQGILRLYNLLNKSESKRKWQIITEAFRRAKAGSSITL